MAMRIFLLCLFSQSSHGLHLCLFDFLLVVSELLACLLYRLVDHRSDILHVFQERHCKTFAWKFFVAVHRPVSVLEVVVFHAAEFLDVAISAVVVCDQKTFLGDDLAGTSSSELDDGILEGAVVYVVDLFGSEFTSQFLHGVCVHLLEERKHPHSLVSQCAETYRQSRDDCYNSFHIILVFICHPEEPEGRREDL